MAHLVDDVRQLPPFREKPVCVQPVVARQRDARAWMGVKPPDDEQVRKCTLLRLLELTPRLLGKSDAVAGRARRMRGDSSFDDDERTDVVSRDAAD